MFSFYIYVVTKNPSRKDQGVAPKKLSLTSLSVGVESNFESSFLLNFGRSAIEVTLDTQNNPDNLYDLNALALHLDVQPPYLSSQDTGRRILQKILPPTINVIGPSQVRGFQTLDISHIVSKVLPDLLVCPSDGAPPVLMVEVQSKEFVQAIRRLYLELYMHLITLRSRIPHVKKMSGFVVPKSGIELGTIMATVTWESAYMSFVASMQRLSKVQFSDEVLRAYENQSGYFLLPTEHTHSFPITIMELQNFLNINDIQGLFPSKFSIVFYTSSCVWKCPLVHNSLSWIVPPTECKQVLYHERIIKKFYVFKRLACPLDLESIKLRCFKHFAISLFRAIEEMHSHGYAHQDIRLPNVCFDFNGNDCYAVLIDLDQANFVDFPPVIKGNSLMYSTSITTSGKLDWRQYAFLISKIRNGISTDDYHTTPPDFTGLDFLKPSFDNGEKPLIDQISQSLERFGCDLELSHIVTRF